MDYKIIFSFENKRIRAAWDEEEEEWYFSIVDVVAALTDSIDPATYWRKLKQRLIAEGNETVTNCHGLKMAAADGKMRITDVATIEQLLRLIQSIPSQKTESFKLWLISVGRKGTMGKNNLSLTPQDDNTDFYNNTFFKDVASIIEQARSFSGRTANVTMCAAYYEIGRKIVESEQDGELRAQYGHGVIRELSSYLKERFGKGFSESTLKYARQFYTVYSNSIRQTNFGESENVLTLSPESVTMRKSQTMFGELNPFKLSWSHYLVLMRIKNEEERCFYEIEAINENWTLEELKRQYDSSLYERLALSRDKNEIMRLAQEGQTIEKPRDLMKNPLVLEFYGLEQMPSYSESDLESAIIANLQKFLLELGKGFLFESRQKRFSFDEKSFFVDLVFYNRLLQCYVLIDLKRGELHHQDLGQMLMYVNYFDRYVRQEFEKQTVGILLCSQKDDNIVELTLPEDSNIYASEYSLYLPEKTLLQRKLAEWIKEFEEEHGNNAK